MSDGWLQDESQIAQFYVALGKEVQVLRCRLSATQAQLGARLGLCRSAVSDIEKGKRMVALHQVARLEHLFALPIGALTERAAKRAAENAMSKR